MKRNKLSFQLRFIALILALPLLLVLAVLHFVGRLFLSFARWLDRKIDDLFEGLT
jgi:hypothetical protein